MSSFVKLSKFLSKIINIACPYFTMADMALNSGALEVSKSS